MAHAGDLLELLGEDVLRRADSEVAVIELAGVLLGVLDELPEVLCGIVRRYGDCVVVFGEQRDRRDIRHLVLGVLVEERVDGIEVGAGEQCVPVAALR
jgi:hypothetical protein